MANNHLIGKQVMLISVGSMEDAFALQQRFSEMVWTKLSPRLSDLFDRFAGENEVLQLDKVELNLGDIDLYGSNYGMIIDKILQLLEVELRQFKVLPISKTGSAINGHLLQNSSRSTQDYMFHLWLYWLKNGILPAYAIKPDDKWMTQVHETLAMEQPAVLLLRKTLIKNKNALNRLILQHLDKDLKIIVELYTGYSQNDLPVFLGEIKEYLIQDAQPETQFKMTFRELHIGFWELILKKVILQAMKLTSVDLQQSFLAALPKMFLQNMEEVIETKSENYPQISQIFKSMGNGSEKGAKTSESAPNKRLNMADERPAGAHKNLPDLEDKADKLRERLPQLYQDSKDIDKQSVNGVEYPGSGIEDSENHSFGLAAGLGKLSGSGIEEGEGMPEKEDKGGHGIEEEMKSPHFFKNAGLVLLHSFLHRFFQNLELVEDRQFKDFDSQSKSVRLLQFLVTGDEMIPEYEMLLPKFLCAMPANLPMDHSTLLTHKEKKETIRLLEAVIENWGVLGSTSPDGLREGFLIRDGKLLRTDSGWNLIIEPKTIDILLDRLPWGISMIKLPWMEELLKVEWR